MLSYCFSSKIAYNLSSERALFSPIVVFKVLNSVIASDFAVSIAFTFFFIDFSSVPILSSFSLSWLSLVFRSSFNSSLFSLILSFSFLRVLISSYADSSCPSNFCSFFVVFSLNYKNFNSISSLAIVTLVRFDFNYLFAEIIESLVFSDYSSSSLTFLSYFSKSASCCLKEEICLFNYLFSLCRV